MITFTVTEEEILSFPYYISDQQTFLALLKSKGAPMLGDTILEPDFSFNSEMIEDPFERKLTFRFWKPDGQTSH